MRTSHLRETTDHLTEQARAKVFDPPILLIVVRGMSLAGRIPLAVTAVPTAINQDLRALRPHPHIHLDPWYLFAYLKSVEEELLGATRGTSHGSLSLPVEVLQELSVPMPPPEVRDIIAHATKMVVELAEEADRLRMLVGGLMPATLHHAFGPGRRDQG
jgi:type I restriction enzyme S subunit